MKGYIIFFSYIFVIFKNYVDAATFNFDNGLNGWKSARGGWVWESRSSLSNPVPGIEEEGFAVLHTQYGSDDLFLNGFHMPEGGVMTIKFFGKSTYVGTDTLRVETFYESQLDGHVIRDLSKFISPDSNSWITETFDIPADARDFGVSESLSHRNVVNGILMKISNFHFLIFCIKFY